MKKRLFIILKLCLFIPYTLYGQPTVSNFELTAQNIKEVRPEISENVINQDIFKIKANYLSISEKFVEVGFDKKDTSDAVLYGWSYVRLSSPLQTTKSINSKSFFEFMTTEFLDSYGLVIFTSNPEKAEIIADGESLGISAQKKWYSIGSVSVTCRKEGFSDGTNTCNITRGPNTCPCDLGSTQ